MLRPYNPKAQKILQDVAQEFGMTVPTMLYRGKSSGKVAARYQAMRRMRDDLGMGHNAIAAVMNMHHTTVMHHLAKDPKGWETVAVKGRRCRSKELTMADARRIIEQQAQMLRDMATQVETLVKQIQVLSRG